jgi:hypothetical protein
MTKKISCLQEEWDRLTAIASKKYISTKDRMDVEDAIQHVENTVEDIDALIERYVDRPDHISEDEMWNYLEGIKCVLKLRMDALWNAHRQRECIDGYGTFEEIMEQRAKDSLPTLKVFKDAIEKTPKKKKVSKKK